MNDINKQERNEQILRYLAIIGFVVMVIALAYLAVQVVRFIPTAFSNLANIFEANQRSLYEDANSDEEDDENVVVVEDEEDDRLSPTDEEDDTDNVSTTTPDVIDRDEKPTVTGGSGTPAPVQYRTVVTYKTPVSDPNGYTDLETTFVAVGYVSSNGRFVATDHLNEGDNSAVQFKVKNIGTKTSGNWHFEADLPNGGDMTSKSQAPLKPQETATLTIVFSTKDSRGNENIHIRVHGGGDINLSNNKFETRVRVR